MALKRIVHKIGYALLIYILLDFFVLKLVLPPVKEDLGLVNKPYVMFTGNGDWNENNEDGFIYPVLKDLKDSSGIKIAFFGGSTGISGDPTIASSIESYLRDALDTTVYVANYSVIASNHRQHLHYLLEYCMPVPTDLMVFYGGCNETIGSLLQDPRPGYPYNYYYQVETSFWRKWLISNSCIMNQLERMFGVMSGQGRLRAEVKLKSDEWTSAIAHDYISCLHAANSLAKVNQSPQSTFKRPFLGFYQPYQFDHVPLIHEQILDSIESLDHIIDYSNALDIFGDTVFTDYVHVQQFGRDHMAQLIAKEIIRNIE